MRDYIAGDMSSNTESGSELFYKFTHTPIVGSLIGRIEVNNRVTQRIAEEFNVIRFYDSMWVQKEIDGPQALYGRVVDGGIIIVWDDDISVGQSTVYLNYKYMKKLAFDAKHFLIE